jgi:fumarate hydratase class II
VIPTALHIAALLAIHEELEPAVELLGAEIAAKSKEFWGVIKTGRTHLQDATPIRMGQVFLGYAGQMEKSVRRLCQAKDELALVPLGGTAVGTGINTHPEFAKRVLAIVSKDAGIDVRETDNHFQAQATIDAVVQASANVRTVAVSLLKIANDIRLMGSGPRCGLGELALPEVQPGSSIMPGKVNPVIAESLIQAASQTIASDVAVLQAGQWSFFELNTMLPFAAHNLVQSIEILAAATRNFAERCMRGIKATERGPELVERGLAICTGLVPLIGYDAAASIAKQAAKSGKTVREVARETTSLTAEQLDAALDPFKMTEPTS